MNICLSHRSALECWRFLRRAGDEYVTTLLTEYERRRTLERPSVSRIGIERLADRLQLSLPVCVEIPPGCKRRNTAYCRFIQRPAPLENNRLLEIDDEITLPSPEAVMLQMAETLDVVDLTRLGMELSAAFVLRQPTKQIVRAIPLLDVEKAAELARRATTTAERKLLRALPHIYPRCESPAEISMALKLLLPTRWGGLGLKGASINPVLELSKAAQDIAGRKTCRPDMLFSEIKLDLEYDGVEWHTTPDQLVNDMKRWHALRREGFKVISINAEILREPSLMTRLAKEVERTQGKEQRIRTAGFEEKQRELFRRLSSPKQIV